VGALCGYLPDSVAHDSGVPHVDSASEYEDASKHGVSG
jgi:hypothetical protein